MTTKALARAQSATLWLTGLTLTLASACGTTQPVPTTAPSPEASSTATPAAGPLVNSPPPVAEESAHALPTSCVGDPICTPSKDFADRICSGSYPDAALYLFAPKTPWKRAYLRRAFQAWYVGGHGDMRELHTSEEVLILTVRQGSGEGIQIGGGGRAFDALRWDGTCVSLMEDEISFQKPPGAVPANISWKALDPNFQAAFAEEKGIEALHVNQVRLCDNPQADKEPQKTKCAIAREQLSLAIAQSVGRGKTLPALASIP